jgi:hypothetical protein
MFNSTLRAFIRYVRKPAVRSAEEFGDAIEEELAFHIAERTREHMTQGLSEEEAQRRALARFGNVSRVAVECHAAAVGGLALWHWLHLGMTALLAALVAVLWYQLPAANDGALLSAASLPPGIASMLDNDWTGDITGQILDELGQPIESATVLVVVKTWPDQSYFQRAYTAVTDPQGRFLIENVHPLNERYAVQITALAEERVLKSSYQQRSSGALQPVVFQLPPSSGFALQVEAEHGVTLAGVEVMPHGRVEAGGIEHLVYFDSAQPIVRRTDARGRVELPYFEPGDTATVMFRTHEGDWESRDIVVPARGEVATIRASLGAI